MAKGHSFGGNLPEAREFLEAGSPKPQGLASEVDAAVKVKVPKAKQQQAPEEPRVSQTYRLPRSLVNTLSREANERKIARVSPWSQQDIVAEALTAWLRTNGSQ